MLNIGEGQEASCCEYRPDDGSSKHVWNVG
jgi:hypothetical protein